MNQDEYPVSLTVAAWNKILEALEIAKEHNQLLDWDKEAEEYTAVADEINAEIGLLLQQPEKTDKA
jgi:hypothetical protein